MSLDALADLGILAHNGHDAISGNAQKRRRLESGGRGLRRLRKDFRDRIEMESDEHPSAGNSGYAEKTAAIEECGLHRTSLLRPEFMASGQGSQHDRYCNAIWVDLVSSFAGERNCCMSSAISGNRTLNFLLWFLFFSTNWGICFSFRAISNGLNLAPKCTVPARQRTCFCQPLIYMEQSALEREVRQVS